MQSKCVKACFFCDQNALIFNIFGDGTPNTPARRGTLWPCTGQSTPCHRLYPLTFMWNDGPAFYRATACNATHGIAVGILSVRLSVRCVYCDKTKQRTANILTPHETAITLVFWHQQWLVGDAPFPLKYALKVTHPLRKTPTSTDFRS